MEISSLSLHGNRAQYSDIALENALKNMHKLYPQSLNPVTAENTELLQRKLIRIETELFDDIWGIGHHRTFQEAFQTLILQPQGNRKLWDAVWATAETARVTLRQILFQKQSYVHSQLPVDVLRVSNYIPTNILQTDFPSVSLSTIDNAYWDDISNKVHTKPSMYEYDQSDVLDIVLSGF